MAMKNAGRVAPLPKGEYNAETIYEKLDIVTFLGTAYICKASSGIMGVTPTNSMYWQILSERGDTTECERIVREIRNEIANLNPGSTTADAQVAANTASIKKLEEKDIDISMDDYNKLVEQGAVDNTKNYYIFEE